MANYAFTIDSTFQPFSMQEMLTPFVAYKDAFEKSEEAYDELNKSLDFEGMRNLPEDSKARKIYESYANDLTKQAEDLAQNGLTMGNRRSLMSLKRRYKSEMGRIIKADEAMREEKKLRQSLNAQDSSRLYATDNLNIDDFLDGNNPNLYSISGNELYARGAEAAKAASSRMTQFGEAGSLLGGLYKDIVQKNGYGQKAMQEFMNSVESIPELAAMVDNIMNASGASENLTGVSRGRARQNIINGMFNGAIYQEQHNPTRDPNVLDAMQKKQYDLQKQELGLKLLALQGKTSNGSNGSKGNPSYPKPTNIEYIAGNGLVPPQKVDNVSTSATPVDVNVEESKDPKTGRVTGSKYVVSVGDGKNKLVLGKIDGEGKITDLIGDTDEDYDKFAEYFGHGMSWYQWGHTYDPEYDRNNIKAILKDIIQRGKSEGGLGYMNYRYYLEPDNVGYGNQGGGFYREPYGDSKATVFNEDPNSFDPGYGMKSN